MCSGSDVLSPLIRWCEIDGIVFVLDLKADMYSALTTSLSRAWIDAARSGSAGPNIENILTQRGWRPSDATGLASPEPSARIVAARLPAIRAAACLLRARRSLRDVGLAATMAWAERHQKVTSDVPLTRALAAFRRVEGCLPNRKGDLDCLPRSIALFAMLRGYGFAATHKIGLHRFPFDAHAWVEVDDVPVLERAAPRDDDAAEPHYAPRTVIMKSC